VTAANADTDQTRRGGSRLKRVGLAALIGLVGINVWTGSPLLGLWIGSRVQGSGPPSMAAVAVVFVTFIAISILLVKVLARLQAAYDDATGAPTVRQHVPWLRSMRGERPQYPGTEVRLSTPDRILVVIVIGVVVLFEIWFFFFSGSPIDGRSGRGQVGPDAVAAAGAMETPGDAPYLAPPDRPARSN
jgi:hypothetical protein